MIEFLSGKLKCRMATGIILDVNGVGYGVDLPLPVLCDMPSVGSQLDLWIFTRVKEDAFKLYGFLTQAERFTFEVLINISGVGPKVALAIMSTLNVSTLRHAVETAEPEILQIVPGIGKRTAEKILLELKPKVDRLISPENESIAVANGLIANNKGEAGVQLDPQVQAIKSDLQSALMNLGFKEKDVKQAINVAISDGLAHDFSLSLKASLNFLRSGKNETSSINAAAKKAKKSQTELLDTVF